MTQNIDEPLSALQTVACPRCYMKMRVHYEARRGSRTTFDKFLTCLNAQCKHVFVASLFGPYSEGPFPIR